ncbi:MAG: PASTA domain-containing protein, partial [Desulfuromonadaceae bacterium]
FVMGSQGSGVAFKAGTSTIIAHKDDLVAYFDVKVVARVPNLVGREVLEAMGMLQGLGLDGGLPIEVPIKQKRKVTGQSVAAGTLAEANTLIVLEVSPTATGSEPESKPGNRQPASVFSTQGGESKEQRGTSGFSSSGGEEKPTATAPPASAPAADAGGINLLGTQTASQDCGQLQSSFDAALDLGDTLWAQSLLDEGRKCGFSAAGASRLNQLQAEQDLQEEQRLAEKCSAAEKRFYASLNGNKLQSAQQLLPALQTCPCYSQALAELGQRRKKQQCAQLSQQFNRQIANHRVSQARATVQQAQAAGCPINLSAAEGALDRAQQEVAQAEERRRAQQLQQQRRQAQQQQQLLNAMQGLFQSVQQQQQHSSHSGPTSNRVPPVTTPAPTSSPSAPSRPQKNCQKVCVREKVVWKNISDGRDHLCAGGVPRPPGPGLKPPRCEKTVHCLQWETRCQ